MEISELYKLYLAHPVISTDTRQNIKGTIFFALKGENFDANLFIEEALQKGALYVISDNPGNLINDKIIRVHDSLITLQELAKLHRRNLSIPVIAITGSNGKTTTKELTGAVLNKKFNTFVTPGNLNNHIGVPLSILRINNEHEMAVLELGANHIGEHQLLTSICSPDFGLTTNIGKDHLGEFGGMLGVIESYKEFVDYFNQNPSYTFFFNNNDRFLRKLVTTTNVISFKNENPGRNDKIHCTGEVIKGSIYLNAKINFLGNEYWENFKLETQFFGSFNLMNILAATTIGLYFKVSPAQIKEAIEAYQPKNMRSQVIQSGSNTIILDAYNANPSSMMLALDDFADMYAKSKIVILGDMLELGKYSSREHKIIVNFVKNLGFDQVILVGPEFGRYKPLINCLHFNDSEELKSWFQTRNFTETHFLLKGSRGIRLEKAFEDLK
jgi:UDP-N-acetylmuramoyl-tripeptide--D-alanyl-D-alanine ligase